MATKNDVLVEDLEKLKPLPDQSSLTPAGRYVLKSVQPIEYLSPDNQFNSLVCNTIQRIKKIQLFAESHDQGFADDEFGGNWTWFELAIKNEDASAPRVKDGVELVWRSHPNRFKTDEFGWETGTEFGEKHDMLRLLEPPNRIAVRVCARFTGWAIYAKSGLLVFDIGDQIVNRKPLEFGDTVAHVRSMQKTMTEVNLQIGAAFLPTLQVGQFRADSIGVPGAPPLRVLALDGGGVRGLASLEMLQAVMAKAAPGKRPCEVFDIIGGTSTGGLIAIMLGRLCMTIPETIEKYQKFMVTIFGKGKATDAGKSSDTGKGVIGSFIDSVKDAANSAANAVKDAINTTKSAVNVLGWGEMYDSKKLEQVIKEIVKERLRNEDEKLLSDGIPNWAKPLPAGIKPCRVFCMAVRREAANNRAPVFLRSYINDKDKSLLPDIKIWEAARATSAAPAYFAPMKVGDYELVDGGLGANNPLGWLWTEILGVYGPARPTTCFLSLGTGIPPNYGASTVYGDVVGLTAVATNTQIMHVLFRTLIDAFAPKPLAPKYFRLNVGEYTGGDVEKDLHSYAKIGNLDAVDALPELQNMVKRFILAQDAMIVDCAKAISASL